MTPEQERGRRIDAVAYDYAARDKERVDRCNLCASGAMPVSERDRYGFEAVLCVCERCGLGFLSPRLTAAEYARFYSETYRPLVSAYHGRRIDAETVQEDQHGYAEELAGFLVGRLAAAPRTILDVGGSTGVVGGLLGDRSGAEVCVLDPAPEELEVAAAAGMETIAGFAEDYDPAGRTWELVLLCQTVDHLLDVAATLEAMAKMVAPGGYAFVDALDVGLMAERTGSIEGAVKIDHPFYLTHATAHGFFATAGFTVEAERLSADNHWGFLLARGEVAEPDWAELSRAREEFLAGVGA